MWGGGRFKRQGTYIYLWLIRVVVLLLKECVGSGHSKANKQARLVERKVCFISDAGN